jgi:hypothetical protein
MTVSRITIVTWTAEAVECKKKDTISGYCFENRYELQLTKTQNTKTKGTIRREERRDDSREAPGGRSYESRSGRICENKRNRRLASRQILQNEKTLTIVVLVNKRGVVSDESGNESNQRFICKFIGDTFESRSVRKRIVSSRFAIDQIERNLTHFVHISQTGPLSMYHQNA